jgi:hypothetical protein
VARPDQAGLRPQWQLLRVYGARLLTSDAPVSLWTAPQNIGPFGGTGGFAVCDEIVLPLDRRHALLLLNTSPIEDELMTPVTREMAYELSTRTAFSGNRWIFHHPGDSPLHDMVLPPSTPKISAAEPPFRLVPDDVQVTGPLPRSVRFPPTLGSPAARAADDRGVATWLPRTPSPDGTQRNQQERDRDHNPAEDLQVGAASRFCVRFPPSSIPVPPTTRSPI